MIVEGPLTVDTNAMLRMYEKRVLNGIHGILVIKGYHCLQTIDIGLKGLPSWIPQDEWTIMLQMLIMGRTDGHVHIDRSTN